MGHASEIIFLIIIIVFWFTEGTVMAYMAKDSFLSGADSQKEFNNSITKASRYNFTNQESTSEVATSSGLFSTLSRMFAFGIGTSGFPFLINTIISVINLILAVVLALLIYRLGNPLA